MAWTNDHVSLLISTYEKFPLLYNFKNPKYHNRSSRQMALQKIIEALKSIRPNTTETDVLKKVSGLRNTYMTENRKVIQSRESGAEADDIYTPSLWYYHKLHFLRDYLDIRKSKSNLLIDQRNTNTELTEPTLKQGLTEPTIKQELTEPALKQELTYDEDLDETSTPTPATIDAYTDEIDDELQPISPNDLHAPGSSSGSSSSCRSGTPTNTIDQLPVPQTKKRKISDSFDFAATEVLKQISVAATSIDRPRSDSATVDEVYGIYVGKSLAALQNRRNRNNTQRKIDEILYEAKMNELDT